MERAIRQAVCACVPRFSQRLRSFSAAVKRGDVGDVSCVPENRVCPREASAPCHLPWYHAGVGGVLMMSTLSNSFFDQNVDLPMELPVKKKKPFFKPRKMNGKKLQDNGDKVLQPPANGLLVSELIPVAHETMKARATLMSGAHRLLKTFPVKACRYCPAVHVGPVGHQIASCLGPHNGPRHGRHDWINGRIDDVLPRMDVFHLSDRLGKVITHDDRNKIDKAPAVVELCVQAGVDVSGYPTKRRTKPVVMIEKKLIDFDDVDNDVTADVWIPRVARAKKFDERSLYPSESLDAMEVSTLDKEALAALAEKTLQAWYAMRSGAKKLMGKYYVHVCGYCPQVHVGPKGTKTCDCKAFKHQLRSGHHGWQEASIDDLVPPTYVWHLRERCGPPLATELRVFYGVAPAIVELCMQAGAAVPEEYKPMMRLDVVIPDLSELDKVA